MNKMKLCSLFRVFRSLPYSIWFNFHYLPFAQAVRLPILLYKPTLKKCGGQIILEGKAYPGRVRLGFPSVPIYPNNGIMWENRGTIKFEGQCSIGNSSYISVGQFGNLILGDRFIATTALRLICFHSIKFAEQVLVGWDNLFCDTDFHKIVGGGIPYGPITIEKNNWFAMKSVTLKNTHTPAYCIVGANSLLNRDYSEYPSECLIAGNPAVLKKTGLYRDPKYDEVNYQ